MPININNGQYNGESYADAVIKLLDRVAKLEELIEEGGFVTEETLETTLSSYAKTSDLSDYAKESELSRYATISDLSTTNVKVTNLTERVETNETNWEAIISDLETLPSE